MAGGIANCIHRASAHLQISKARCWLTQSPGVLHDMPEWPLQMPEQKKKDMTGSTEANYLHMSIHENMWELFIGQFFFFFLLPCYRFISPGTFEKVNVLEEVHQLVVSGILCQRRKKEVRSEKCRSTWTWRKSYWQEIALASVQFWKGDKIWSTFQPDLTKFGVSSSFTPSEGTAHAYFNACCCWQETYLFGNVCRDEGRFSRQDGPVGCQIGAKTPWQN